MNKPTHPVVIKLADPSIPPDHRLQMLVDVVNGDQSSPKCKQIVGEVLQKLTDNSYDELARERTDQLEEILKQLESAPMRPATFIELVKMDGARTPHALVALDNGEFGCVVVHDHAAVSKLKLGDRIVLDSKAMIVMTTMLNEFQYGHEARLERKIDNRHIEVISHQDEKMVVLANQKIMADIEAAKIKNGASLVLCSGGQVALCALPMEDDTIHNFRFIDRGSVPDVLVDRDIGCPPRIISQVAKHIREEMTRPELRRKFRLRPCITRLLAGVSGTGKTLAVQAMHRQMYEIMSEVTDTPINDLPKRVFRFRTSQVLSMWLGESDKNADRLFDEVEQMAARTFTNAKGKEFKLPVMVVMEEADGMGRSRGGNDNGVYDRILTTILQRLDPNRAGLSDQLVVFLSTTNEARMIDPAFLRRIGGQVEVFGRLDQKAFMEILRKHTDGLPASNGHGSSKNAWKSIINYLNAWLYSEEGDEGIVELQCSGVAHPVVRHRRDFMTPALIDRAVQEASNEAWEASIEDSEAGITAKHLQSAMDRQIMSVVGQLGTHNIGHYLDLPEGVRVSGIRVISKSSK